MKGSMALLKIGWLRVGLPMSSRARDWQAVANKIANTYTPYRLNVVGFQAEGSQYGYVNDNKVTVVTYYVLIFYSYRLTWIYNRPHPIRVVFFHDRRSLIIDSSIALNHPCIPPPHVYIHSFERSKFVPIVPCSTWTDPSLSFLVNLHYQDIAWQLPRLYLLIRIKSPGTTEFTISVYMDLFWIS